ncbi:MAG TPA: cell surface protein SprA, partial [Saprospiraceae bacterium]|nr:cell surface protein SprA [Saprospiraceae bacterium]
MKFINFVLGLLLLFIVLVSYKSYAGKIDPIDTYSNKYILASRDTIKPRYDDFVNDSIRNPFDLQDPSVIEKTIEYDPETGLYVITEKIGNDYYRAPTYMTFGEYLKWKEKEQRREYFQKLSGGGRSGNMSKRGIVDPASYVDVKKDLVERIFGGNEITIKPQGSIHLTLGVSRQIMDNPAFEYRAQRVWNPIFDEGIQVNVEGGIGDKMKLNFNYNTKASFDFDNKIKLKYDSEQFNEDAILKKIEAGNVSLPLRGNLIQGGQNLFGIKTELQFGHLRLTAIASQQRSEQKSVQIDKGAVKQEFEITPDQYDENRHFFVSHYNRDSYEDAIDSLPNVKTPFRITRIEVWVIPERNETHDLRDICAISDLGEGLIQNYSNPNPYITPTPTPLYYDYTGSSRILPDNRVSSFYDQALKNDSLTRLKTKVSFNLESKYNMKSGRDFEVFKGRKLSPSEFTYNAELGFISLNRPLQPEDVLGVSYEYSYSYNDVNGNRGGEVFRVGEFSEFADTVGKVMYVKMLKSKAQKPGLPEWDL